MAKITTSIGGLINIKKAETLVKKASTLIVGTDEKMTYICNGHWVIRIVIAPGSSLFTAIYSRLGAIPGDGEALQATENGNSSPFILNNLKSFFDPVYEVPCYDTRLTAETDDADLRIFDCGFDRSNGCYIAIKRSYFDALASYETAATKECQSKQPILFTGQYDEAALILPVLYYGSIYLK